MVVYGELLFAENFITGLLILILTGKVCGLERSIVRLMCGGALCGAFSFSILWRLSSFGSFVSAAIFAVLVVVVSFPEVMIKEACPGNIKKISREIKGKVFPASNMLITTSVVFCMVSFVMGGLTLAITGMSGVPGITSNGYVYTGHPTYMKVAVGIGLTYMLLEFFVRCMREKAGSERLVNDVLVMIGEDVFALRAYTDTGNHLRDPVSGRPVSVISRSAADELLRDLADDEKCRRYCTVPFTAAGTRRGVMEGIRADEMRISSRKRTVLCRPCIFAIYDGEFRARDGVPGFDILLNREIIEGGLV